MKFFSIPQSFAVMIKNAAGKMVKVGPSNKKPGIIITARVPLNGKMMEQMPRIVQAMLCSNSERTDQALMMGKHTAEYETRVSARIYSTITGELLIERGFLNANPLRLKVKNFYHVGSQPVMEIELIGLYDKKTWAWCGETIGEADYTLELHPFEGELFPHEDEEEQDQEETKTQPKQTETVSSN